MKDLRRRPLRTAEWKEITLSDKQYVIRTNNTLPFRMMISDENKKVKDESGIVFQAARE